MGDKVKYCSWCGEECEEKPVQVADTPILEHIEEKIDDIGRSQVWGENSDWSNSTPLRSRSIYVMNRNCS